MPRRCIRADLYIPCKLSETLALDLRDIMLRIVREYAHAVVGEQYLYQCTIRLRCYDVVTSPANRASAARARSAAEVVVAFIPPAEPAWRLLQSVNLQHACCSTR